VELSISSQLVVNTIERVIARIIGCKEYLRLKSIQYVLIYKIDKQNEQFNLTILSEITCILLR
jgi:mRNA-degrading endonuclease RelE of RelBE toxin-antitoxin system